MLQARFLIGMCSSQVLALAFHFSIEGGPTAIGLWVALRIHALASELRADEIPPCKPRIEGVEECFGMAATVQQKTKHVRAIVAGNQAILGVDVQPGDIQQVPRPDDVRGLVGRFSLGRVVVENLKQRVDCDPSVFQRLQRKRRDVMVVSARSVAAMASRPRGRRLARSASIRRVMKTSESGLASISRSHSLERSMAGCT